jgi:outer membrane protein OmpA-like peptidoglycan-associated protein
MVKSLGYSVMVLLLLFAGCATQQEVAGKKTATGAAVGAAAGAVTGAVIGHQAGSRTKGAVIGGVAGAAIGTAIGYELDKQAKELEQIPNMEVARYEDSLTVTMSDAVLFDTNSAALKPQAQSVLAQTADVMIRYPDSDLLVKGHTDSTGSEAYNQELSERRAKSVQNFLISKGVAPQRITAIGFGKTMPVATNDTPEGRAQNRRVEIEIRPRQATG